MFTEEEEVEEVITPGINETDRVVLCKCYSGS